MNYVVEEDGLKGEIVLDVPSKFVRLGYIEDCNFKIENGEIELGMSAVTPLRKLYLLAEKHIKKVDLKHSSGKTFKTWKSVIESNLCDNVSEKVAANILTGSKLGEG